MKRYWALLWEGYGGEGYVVPTMCEECHLELVYWPDVGASVIFPFSPLPIHKRVAGAIRYLLTGRWPQEVVLAHQDMENLQAVVSGILSGWEDVGELDDEELDEALEDEE